MRSYRFSTAICALLLGCVTASAQIRGLPAPDDLCGRSKAEVLVPDDGTDYKLRLSRPDENIDYKLIIINPCPPALPLLTRLVPPRQPHGGFFAQPRFGPSPREQNGQALPWWRRQEGQKPGAPSAVELMRGRQQ